MQMLVWDQKVIPIIAMQIRMRLIGVLECTRVKTLMVNNVQMMRPTMVALHMKSSECFQVPDLYIGQSSEFFKVSRTFSRIWRYQGGSSPRPALIAEMRIYLSSTIPPPSPKHCFYPSSALKITQTLSPCLSNI